VFPCSSYLRPLYCIFVSFVAIGLYVCICIIGLASVVPTVYGLKREDVTVKIMYREPCANDICSRMIMGPGPCTDTDR
jgi:hypothetical protein